MTVTTQTKQQVKFWAAEIVAGIGFCAFVWGIGLLMAAF